MARHLVGVIANRKAGSKSSLWWFEPRWSYLPRVKRETAFVFRLVFWLRIIAASLGLAAVALFFARNAAPDLEFNWTRAFLFAVGLPGLSLVSFTWLLRWIPPTISINRHGVCRDKYWKRRSDICKLRVDAVDRSRPVLIVETASQHPLVVGIGPGILPVKLLALLREFFPELMVEENR